MTSAPVHPGQADPVARLRERWTALGLATWCFDASGAIVSAPPADTIAGQWFNSAFLQRILCPVVAGEPDEASDGARVLELFPGCRLIVLDRRRRRRLEGRVAVMALGSEALTAEQFDAACQAARLDAQAARKEMASRAIFAGDEVRRLALLVGWMHDDETTIEREQAEISDVSQQLSESYEEISLLYTLGRSMNEVAHPDNFVRLACEELRSTMMFRWVGAVFSDDEESARIMAGRTFVAGEPPCDTPAFDAAAQAIVRRIEGQSPAVIEADQRGPLGRGRSQLLANPIRHDGRVVGALLAGDKQGDDPEVSSVDMKPLENAAALMSVLLDNAFLYDQQQRTFLGTLEALTASIDAKDPYTCGHSERVAELAFALAREAGLSTQESNRVRISGLVHDIGKIGVPEAVLCKPGRLTDEEFGLIKLHPRIGYEILKDIPTLEDVLPGVLYHHERYDGMGYPSGLTGQDIPRMARILGLADSFDAMSSTRTYRSAMPREKTLEEIRVNAGTQFDPELAEAFLRLDLAFYDRMVSRHQVEFDRDARVSRRSASRTGIARMTGADDGGDGP